MFSSNCDSPISESWWVMMQWHMIESHLNRYFTLGMRFCAQLMIINNIHSTHSTGSSLKVSLTCVNFNAMTQTWHSEIKAGMLWEPTFNTSPGLWPFSSLARSCENSNVTLCLNSWPHCSVNVTHVTVCVRMRWWGDIYILYAIYAS